MAFVKKTWKDRLVEYAGRRKITNTSTNESQIVDVERAEGTVSEEGSAFSAANMNDLEQRISDEFGEVNKNLGGNILTYDESEDAYYIQYGADSVPKKLGSVAQVINFDESIRYYDGTVIELGFHPKQIYAKCTERTASFIYDESYSTTKVKENNPETSGTTIGSTYCLLKSISDTGFTFNMNNGNIAYGNGGFVIFAIG